MNPLSDLKPEEILALSDSDFQGKVKDHARTRTAKALSTIEEVMDESDDDQARLIAATKMLKIAKAEDEQLVALPTGISEEVFRIAIAGLGKLAEIAADASPSSVLRNVTPASTDPRPFIADDSPLNRRPALLDSQESPDEDIHEENVQVEEEG